MPAMRLAHAPSGMLISCAIQPAAAKNTGKKMGLEISLGPNKV